MSAMVAALPYKAFELDRFFVPKEAVLLIAAGVACWAAARARAAEGATRDRMERLTDGALVAFLVVSALSAALASSGWLAVRALAISVAGAALFWSTRATAGAGAAGTILPALVVAVGVAAATALGQAYGLRSEYFSLNRAPGGTFGNRNFVAHLCAIGLPLAGYVALRARRVGAALGALLVALALCAMLVLSRSRGAWLAAASAAVPFALGVVRAVSLSREANRTGRGGGWRPRVGRLLLIPITVGVGAAAAVVLPNALDWRSDSPYLDSVKGVVDYREGSGHGRVAQWRNSMRLLAERPVLGVGPGNWSVRYPAVAPAGDASLSSEGTTANPWPSSDWVAMASERGVVGAGALALAVLGLLLTAHRAVWQPDDAPEPGVPSEAAARALAGGALGAVLVAALVAGAFDAVLLLAAPTAVVWPALGVLAAEGGGVRRSPAAPWADGHVAASRRLRLWRAGAWVGAAALGLAALVAVAHAAGMALHGDGGSAAAVRWTARLAPGDFRIRSRAAALAYGRGGCAAARADAEAAHALAPAAAGPRRILAACGARRPARMPRGA